MPITIDVSESVWYQDVFAKGIAKGKAEGEARGKAQGELAESRALLLRLLKKRFGEVPEDVKTRIENAPLASTETWILNILDATRLEDVFQEA